MSYENTSCPCGNTKPTDTMLCDDCVTAFADCPETKTMRDATLPVEYLRHSAMILLSLSRRRKRNLANGKLTGSDQR